MKYLLSLFILLCILIHAEQPVGAVFLPSIDYDEVQFSIISKALDEHCIKYFIISDNYDTCRSSEGSYLTPYTSLDSLNIDIDFLIIPGNSGILRVKDNEKLLNIVREINDRDGLLGSTDIGGLILLNAGITDNHKISMFLNDNIYNQYKDSDVDFVAYDAIISGNIITSYSSEYIKWFISAFIKAYNETFDTESK